MRRILIISIAAVLSMTLGSGGTAFADPSTGRLRTLDCGDAGVISVELGPAELLTTSSAAIHVVGSTTVLVPARIVVVTPEGDTFVILDKKVPARGGVVTCGYTDPAGLDVTITGTLKPPT